MTDFPIILDHEFDSVTSYKHYGPIKRKMNEDSSILSSEFHSNNLSLFAKRSKIVEAKLVNSCDDILAKKVEPGYLVKLAQDIEKANDFVLSSACGKLKIIEDQMSLLKNQALQILVDTKISSILHSLACNFPKKTEHVYSVFRKPTGEYYFSMLSPSEWGTSAPHEYIGSFKLEGSQSWSPVDAFSKSSAIHHWIQSHNENMMIE